MQLAAVQIEGLLFQASGTQPLQGASSYKSTIDASAQQTAPHSTNDNVKKCFKWIKALSEEDTARETGDE